MLITLFHPFHHCKPATTETGETLFALTKAFFIKQFMLRKALIGRCIFIIDNVLLRAQRFYER